MSLWEPILDSIEGWLEGLWNHVSNIIWSGVQWVIDRVWEGLRWISDRLAETGWWLSDRLADTQFWLKDRFEGFIDTLWTNVSAAFGWISDQIINGLAAIGKAYVDFSHWLADQLTSAGTTIINVTEAVGTGLWNLITGNFDQINKDFNAWLEDSAADIMTEIEKAATESGQNMDDINAAIEASYGGLSTQIDLSAGAVWDSVIGLAGDLLGGMATNLGTAIQGFAEWLFTHLSRFADLVIGAVHFIVEKIRGAVEGLVAWFTEGITGAMMEGSPPQEIEIASNVLMETSFSRQFDLIDNIYHSEASSQDTIMSAQGLMGMLFAGGAVAMSMAIAADQVHPLKNMGWRPTVRELVYWAGIPSVTAAIAVLPSTVGLLVPLRYALYERWQPLIPDAPDLIRFAVREVFVEEERERLITPSPGADFYTYMAKQGYSRKWADSYWASHWVRPTITQLTQMFYRGILDRAEWEKEVRLNDYVPYAIDWLEKIVHPPYTRVDIRRMWDMRTISSAEMLREYKWLGYDDEHANGMVLWTKVYTALPDLVARYKNGWISQEDILQELLTLGMPEERAIELLQTKIKAVQSERISGERDLTKTDLLKLLGIGEISESQAKELLMSIGYDDIEATYLVAIQLDRMVEEVKDLTSAMILKAYKYEINNRETTLDKLIEAGWSATAAETMLRLEDVRLADAQVERSRERDLTRSDIIKSVQNGILDVQTGFNYLAYLGYSEWEIQVIFALEGIEWLTGA